MSQEGKKTQGTLLVDTKKCQGCLTCMLACSLVHEGEVNLAKSRIQVIQSSFSAYPSDIQTIHRETCDLCIEAPYWDFEAGLGGKQACIESCPLGAVRLVTDANTVSAGTPNFRGDGWMRIGYPID